MQLQVQTFSVGLNHINFVILYLSLLDNKKKEKHDSIHRFLYKRQFRCEYSNDCSKLLLTGWHQFVHSDIKLMTVK